MMYIESLITILVPLVSWILPGLGLSKYLTGVGVVHAARVLLVSIASLSVSLFIAAVLHVPAVIVVGLWVLLTIVLTVKHYFFSNLSLASVQQELRRGLFITIIFLFGTLLFAVPFLFWHSGLPAGDSQKAIYWAEQITTTHSLPSYSTAIGELNRDPVDFYTPELHALTASLMTLSPQPLTTIGIFSITICMAIGVIVVALVSVLFTFPSSWRVNTFALILLFTNIRFLRYLKEPGYHFQNLIGELLLFGILFIGLSLLQRWRWADLALIILLFSALLLSHQFSVFLAAFAFLPLYLLFLWLKLRQQIITHQYALRTIVFIAVAAFVLLLTIGYFGNLYTKIPTLFTFSPHLLSDVPTLLEYVQLFGGLWLFTGLLGIVSLLVSARTEAHRFEYLGFAGVAIILFLLSQGPRFGVDIPPVRALLYSCVPLAIAGGYFLNLLWNLQLPTAWKRHTLRATLGVLIIGLGGNALVAGMRPTTAIRTNSSYQTTQVAINKWLVATSGGGVLIDDYNKRSTSWLLLSGHPTFSRLASDVSRQMAEAKQSSLRESLYLRQLEFEKIFSLASLPEVATLLKRNDISWVTGIRGSSMTGFATNPLLHEEVHADDTTLYSIDPTTQQQPSSELGTWLMRPTTLANDIGDEEDVYSHLPASIRAARLSSIKVAEATTYRDTTSPFIPLEFNVGDYVHTLWSKEQPGQPDIATEVYLRLRSRVPELKLRTTSGTLYSLEAAENTIRLEPAQVQYSDDGFVRIMLENPAEAVVGIDVIAMGLARVP